MNFIRHGKFKKGTATNSETGETKPLADLGASLKNYAPVLGEDASLDTTLYGTDLADYIAFKLKVGSSTYTTSGITEIRANGGNDLIDLTSSVADYDVAVAIDGGTGDDTVWSGPHDDTIIGGDGSDSLWGGRGNDFIAGGKDLGDGYFGDNAPDRLFGYDGNDTLLGGIGDTMIGGIGNDRLVLLENLLPASIDGGPGTDVLAFSDTYLPYLSIAGWPGPVAGIEEIAFDDEADEAYIEPLDYDAPVSFDFSGTILRNVTWIFGSYEADTIKGPSAYSSSQGLDLYIDGYAGDDVITGGPTDEWLFGGDDDDTVSGGGGNDTLEGGEGIDSLSGGPGDDTLVLEANIFDEPMDGGADWDVLTLTSDWIDEQELYLPSWSPANAIEEISFGDGLGYIFPEAADSPFSADFSATKLTHIATVDGSSDNDSITGPSSFDLEGIQPYLEITGNEGNDTLIAGAAGDYVLDGGSGGDVLIGGSGADRLFGDIGDDVLRGADGANEFTGGPGVDLLHGGIGDDSYYFAAGWGPIDSIFDDGGTDRVVFSGIARSQVFIAPGGSQITLLTNGNVVVLQNIESAVFSDQTVSLI